MIRRIAVVVCLAVAGLATCVQAEWRIEFESKTVYANETGVTVEVTGCWDLPLQAVAISVVVRSIDPGSFWTGALPYDSFGAYNDRGVTWNWPNPSWATLIQIVDPIVPQSPCSPDGDVGYDGLSSDHFAIGAVGIMTTTPPEPTGRAFVTLTFDVNDNPGQFEFDTACITSTMNGLYLIDDDFPQIDHGSGGTDETVFNKGIITISGNPAEFTLCMDTTSVLPGHNATITLNKIGAAAIGGLDLVISYDPTIAFLNAIPVDDLAAWEYFTYRKSAQDNCGGGCPTGILRLTGIANMPNGITPDEAIYSPEGPLVELTFATPESYDYLNQCFHLSWAWFDCGDNTASSVMGDTLFVAQGILEALPDGGCLNGDKGATPLPKIDFCDGLICIVPPQDDRGDLNLNGIPNEIADAVLFSNYFIFGPGVWDPVYAANQALASDVNDDGIPLTIADLVYLIRVITGDAIPYGESGEGAKVIANSGDVEITCTLDDGLVVSSSSVSDIGAAAFVFSHDGPIGEPVLSAAASGMTLKSADIDGTLRVLLYSMELNVIPPGAHELFTVPITGKSSIEMTEVQASDSKGNMLSVNTGANTRSAAFALQQNYPNPFNAMTTIRFSLPSASDWELQIFNVSGQLITSFAEYNDAGMVGVDWDASGMASGVYFYKLTAGGHSETRKMTLIK